MLIFSIDEQIFWKIASLQSIFATLYTYNNRASAIIIDENRNKTYLTNSIYEIFSKIKMESFIHKFLLSMLETHLLSFNYYINFELLLFLNFASCITNNKNNYKSKEELIYNLEECLEIVKKGLKKLKRKKENMISFIKTNMSHFISSENIFLSHIFQYLIQHEHLMTNNINFKILKTSREDDKKIEAGLSVMIDKNNSNVINLCDYYKIGMNINELNLILFEYEDIEEIIKNEETFHSDLMKQKFPHLLIMTNALLNNRLFDLFTSKNIFILHNIKLKKIRTISKMFDLPINYPPNFLKFINFGKDFLTNAPNNKSKGAQEGVSQKKVKFSLVQKASFKTKNDFYLILQTSQSLKETKDLPILFFVHSISDIEFRKFKNGLKSNLEKLRNILKFKKILVGGGKFEYDIANYLRKKIVKQKYINDRFGLLLTIEILANSFEQIGETLLINEGLKFEEIEKKKKDERPFFYEEYKGKKFCVENVFLFLTLFVKIYFKNQIFIFS